MSSSVRKPKTNADAVAQHVRLCSVSAQPIGVNLRKNCGFLLVGGLCKPDFVLYTFRTAGAWFLMARVFYKHSAPLVL